MWGANLLLPSSLPPSWMGAWHRVGHVTHILLPLGDWEQWLPLTSGASSVLGTVPSEAEGTHSC